MMLGEESEPARIWEEVGNEALRRGIQRIIMMVCISYVFSPLPSSPYQPVPIY